VLSLVAQTYTYCASRQLCVRSKQFRKGRIVHASGEVSMLYAGCARPQRWVGPRFRPTESSPLTPDELPMEPLENVRQH